MSNAIGKTVSVCPVCLRQLTADKVVGEDGFVYMEKNCPEHGPWRTLIWEGDAASYAEWAARDHHTPPVLPFAKQAVHGCPNDCGLCTNHKQATCCTLLELTNRCNLTCPVCFASAGEKEEKDLSLEDIGRAYDYLMAHGGPYNIQLSGGEPTVRNDLADIIALGKEKGFQFFQLNTNGVRLAEEDGYTDYLAAAGVSTVFLQFDGLDDDIYRVLRGRPLKDIKLRAIDNCKRSGLPVVLVPTVAKGVNDHVLGDIIRFALAHAPHVRGVHIQPMSFLGRNSMDPNQSRLTIPAVLRRIEAQTQGMMKISDFSGGGAESPYCSFHASYTRSASGVKAMPKREGCCCCQSSETRDTVAQQWSGQVSCCDNDSATSSLDEFLQKVVENTFTVSGMVFQDAWNLDLERLQRCYICEVDSAYGMVPFCSYNLTNVDGKALYRK
ncbi:MAG: radical SAM protein [Peptococcaceae bacterium]|nr:radical SAM protein [Peptococcaceae bacterium]